MARGRKSLTPEENLERIIGLIKENEDAIKKLKAEKIQVEEEIKQKRLAELDALISESGKSFDEIKELLSK